MPICTWLVPDVGKPVTDVKVISYINKLYEDNSFNKLSVVINGVPEHNLNYGFSYGYEHSKQ